MFNGDDAFVRWRNQFGPNYLVMNSCQVSRTFEQILIGNLTRAGSVDRAGQHPQGLGEGCRPLTTTEQLVVEGTTIATRGQWRQIPEADRAGLEQQLRDLNHQFGYFGQPPIPDSEVVRYFFDVPPQGGWARVEVGVGPHGAERATGIPFWNRNTGPRRSEFNRLCDRGVGELPARRVVTPP